MKSNIFLTIFILITVSSCSSQTDSSRNRNIKNLTTDTIPLLDKGSALDLFVKEYADSINISIKENKYPHFIENTEFDFDYSGIYAPSHHPLPLRFMIVKKVTNCLAIKNILALKNDKIKEKPKNVYNLELLYSDKSFYDLLKMRNYELNCK